MNLLSSILFIALAPILTLQAQSQVEIDPDRSLPRSAHGLIYLNIFPVEGIKSDKAQNIPARKSPDSSSPLVMMIKSPTDISSRGVGNSSAAVVYGQAPGWYQVQTRFGKGWLSRKLTESFVPVECLLKDGSTYLRDDEWDGVIFESSSTTSRILKIESLQKDVKPSNAEFLEWKWSEGQPWIQVKLLAIPHDGEPPILKADITGWIPAYSTTGYLVMWFYPFGC